jgi:hypothetical protein
MDCHNWQSCHLREFGGDLSVACLVVHTLRDNVSTANPFEDKSTY